VRDGVRASAVIKRVREFVKNDGVAPTLLDIRDVIRETIAFLKFDLEKNNIALSLALPDELPKISGDRVQLEQVVMNLMLNACEALTTIRDRPREIRISASNSVDQMVVVSIQDSGIGIDPQRIGQVYDAFFTTKPSGIGMGLSISRSIVEAHGGQISVAPNADCGVTAQFSLPANNVHS
jgi:signal transduction histidine kinase